MMLKEVFPILGWLRGYRWHEQGWQDALAAVMITAMLIPQSLSYALLAGMPVQAGIYASILPLLAYAVFGTSSTLSVGPMAVTSLMSASTIAAAQRQLGVDAFTAAAVFALITGGFLLLMGLLRLGFVANLMSVPVLSGFTNASVIVIIWPQLRQLADVPPHGSWHNGHVVALLVGMVAVALLWWGKARLPGLLARIMPEKHAGSWSKTMPLLVLVATGLFSYFGGLADHLNIVGTVPAGLPALRLPDAGWPVWRYFLVPSLLMALVVYVSAISVGQVLAARRGERIHPNQELVGLGAANVASAVSGAFPVTGGFSRSAVSYEAGAQTQMAAVFTALLMAASVLWLAPLFAPLPKSVLAAVVIVSVAGLFDSSVFRRLWRFHRGEWLVMMTTFAVSLLWRLDAGIAVGMLASFVLYIAQSVKPHMAEIGRLPGSESFRNVQNYAVETWPQILSLRIDDSLQFFNRDYLCESVLRQTADKPQVQQVILQCHGINAVDYSAAEALLKLNTQLAEKGIGLSLSEVKKPVMQQLEKLGLAETLNQQIYLTHNEAVEAALNRNRVWFADL